MRREMIAVATAIVAAAASSPPAQAQGAGMSYATGTIQYRVTSFLRQTRDVMGEKHADELTTMQLVTVEIERGGRDTLMLHITLDSTTVNGITTPDLQRFHGVRMSGTMSSRGKLHDLHAPPEHANTDGMQPVVLSLRGFLVSLPGSTRAGTRWADTTDSEVKTREMDVVRRVVANSTLAGDTSYAGERAYRIRQALDVSMSGAASAEGVDLLMSGIGTGNATYFVTPGGIYLGSESEQETTLELSIGEMKVPIVQTMTATVERLH